MKSDHSLKGKIYLVITAIVWGASFVAQSMGMDNIGPFTFTAVRALLGACSLLPVAIISHRKKQKNLPVGQKKPFLTGKEMLYGFLLGTVFTFAANFQQSAFPYSSSGKIAFITALYILFVPILGIFLKKKVSAYVWGAVALSLVGLFFLCVSPNTDHAFNVGDILALVSSVFFAVHILCIDRFTLEVDGVKLSFMQFLVASVYSTVLMFLVEEPTLPSILAAASPLLYAGVLSCGVAYTCQILGQRDTDPTVASLIMSTESVFAVITAGLILSEWPTPREALGCVIIMAAILFVQLGDYQKMKKQKKTSL